MAEGVGNIFGWNNTCLLFPNSRVITASLAREEEPQILSRIPIINPSTFILTNSAPLKGQGEVSVLVVELTTSEELILKLIL